nr:uncharacterized protein LOC104084769 [Nicotiana tomentosiformis]
MRQVSTPCTVGTPSGRLVAFGTIPEAIQEVGDGYSRVVATVSWKGDCPRQRAAVYRLNGHKILEDLKIKRIASSPYHPSANGWAESTNKVIIQNLKKWLEVAKVKWSEKLPEMFWAYRTMAK